MEQGKLVMETERTFNIGRPIKVSQSFILHKDNEHELIVDSRIRITPYPSDQELLLISNICRLEEQANHNQLLFNLEMAKLISDEGEDARSKTET
ncbi:TPA_asm: hypothetical protein vir519_00029 [Caudoviricetes sp. vir519]|nr:TPA_asm: hypothetical protein vir519_00029 [Caudoviricetes sp. vir519]